MKAPHILSFGSTLVDGIGVTPASQSLPVFADTLPAGAIFSSCGDIRLVPDLCRVFEIPYCPSHLHIFGDFYLNGEVFDACPRGFLKRIIREAAAVGFEVKASFEEEFVILDKSNNLKPVDNTCYAYYSAVSPVANFINELTDCLIAQGVEPELYHPESCCGQHEIAWKYTGALSAADNHIIFRETCHAVAFKHNFVISFLPKTFLEQAGNGLHLHMSLWKGGVNVFGNKNEVSDIGKCFMAGILQHLPGIMAITTSTTNSFRRLIPHAYAGAFQCWGYDNREAAIRVPTTPSGVTNMELKVCDAASNPYLALGVIIAAGLNGVKENADPGPPVQVDPEGTGAQVLPRSLDEVLKHIEADEFLKQTLGSSLYLSYKGVKTAECSFFKDLTFEEEKY